MSTARAAVEDAAEKHGRASLILDKEDFGIEGITAEDRAYNGSRLSEVGDAIFANPYQKVWGRDGEPPLPFATVTLSSLLRGILPFGRRYYFGKAPLRSVDSHADLRWGTVQATLFK